MPITAQAIVERIRQQSGAGWRETSVDAFVAGKPESEVKGVAVTYAPSLEVLHKAVSAGKNMIVSLENPFWTRPAALLPGGTSPDGDQIGPPGYRPARPAAAGGGGGGPQGAASLDNDPVYQAKRDYITANNLVVYRFYENWNARQPNPQLVGLLKALGWASGYKPVEGAPWAAHGAAFVQIPPATLRTTAQSIKATLPMKVIRIIGDPETQVTKAAVKPGIALLVDLERYFAEPGVDLVVMGEAIWENEGMQYAADLVAAGQKKAVILLGQEVSQEPGCGEMTGWLKSFVSEVPVEWISAGDPSWMPK